MASKNTQQVLDLTKQPTLFGGPKPKTASAQASYREPQISSADMQAMIQRDPVLQELVTMHRYRRPAKSATETEFCNKYLAPLNNVVRDEYGNWIGQIGTQPTVLWSSHTDTVHNKPGYQKLLLANQYLGVGTKENKSSCLGADCTVGVWIMRQMYLNKVPGLYIWHAEEECGGHGSTAIAQRCRGLLAGIEAAIAFDRKGTKDVITHQFGSRTASDAFAASMAAFLGGDYEASSNGTFTDTANYEHLVPECTNIAVGYYDAHTSHEVVDLLHARSLLDRMLTFEAGDLTIARDPTVREPFDWMDDPYWRRPHSSVYGGYQDPLLDGSPSLSMRELVKTYPEAVASLLESYGIGVEDIYDELAILGKPQRRR